MKDIHEDLSNHRTYLWMILGSFLGVAIVMAAYLIFPHRNISKVLNNNTANNLAPVVPGEVTQTVAPSYEKALANPDKPFTDEQGVVHPPLGTSVAPQPIDPNNPPPAPPVNSAPVVPPKTTTTVKTTATTTTKK